MDREQQLLAIVQAQTEIAAARPEPDAVMQIVAALALEVIGAQAAAVELAAGGHEHILGTITSHRLDAPLVHDGKPIGTLTVYADHPQAFTVADSETLTLLAGAVAAHLAHASAQAPSRQHVWDDASPALATVTLTSAGSRTSARVAGGTVACSPSCWSISTAPRATACVEPWPPCCSAGRGRSTASTGSARTGSR